VAIVVLAPAISIVACGEDETRHDDSSSTGEHVGQSCAVPDDCYPDVDHPDAGTDAGADAGGGIRGTVTCLTKVTGGYCTHTCVDDSDCCAVDGECKTGHPQVCSPFENQPQKYCFLSCEDNIVGTTDPNTYCHDFANIEFGCRSTGGGSQNRKICLL
jgi:hypothetical protein